MDPWNPGQASNDKSVELSRIYTWRNLLTIIIYCISGPMGALIHRLQVCKFIRP